MSAFRRLLASRVDLQYRRSRRVQGPRDNPLRQEAVSAELLMTPSQEALMFDRSHEKRTRS